MRFLPVAVIALLVGPTVASAAPHSGIANQCHYRFGVASYQSVSYEGQTTCREAKGLIRNFTKDGTRKPKVGRRTGYTPHGVWTCRTIRRREAHGVVFSSHRITCRLREPTSFEARIRFFYEG
jgi:hypothetical protein